MQELYAKCSASISELKRSPSALIKESAGEAIAILNHNKPAAYLVPAETYEWMMEQLDDRMLSQLVEERRTQIGDAVEVSLDDL